MVNKLEAAYKLGQLQAMEKVAYNPTYSQSDIDAVRRYNRDVASGHGSVGGVLGGLTAVGTAGAMAGADRVRGLDKAIAAKRTNLSHANFKNTMRRYIPDSTRIDTSRITRQLERLENLDRGKIFRSGALKYLKANKGKAALLAAGGYGVGRLLGYGGKRLSQGFDNYVYSDLNSQDRRD